MMFDWRPPELNLWTLAALDAQQYGEKEMMRGCQCAACKTVQHASWCAVHNAPALPIGQCNCGAEKK